MKVWIIDEEFNSHELEKALIRSESPGTGIIETGYDLTSALEKYGTEITGILAQIYAKIDSRTMNQMPNLRAISVYGGGFNNIDVQTATSRKIIVSRVPDYCNHEVTEYVLAWILRFARRLDMFAEKAKTGGWGATVVSDAPMDDWATEKIEQVPQRVSGSTLLIIGYGKIGRMLARKASALGMKVLAYDPYVKETEGADLVPSLNEGLAKADFISIHALLTNETRNMIDEEKFRKMKRTAFLINCSRGEITNERDLIEAVKSKTIRGAALDVVAEEPPDQSREVFHTPGIVVTPHVAYLSETSLRELKSRATKNLLMALKGERPPDAVN
jgi:phosphoglycerate dehydrogenase-like enzyme